MPCSQVNRQCTCVCMYPRSEGWSIQNDSLTYTVSVTTSTWPDLLTIGCDQAIDWDDLLQSMTQICRMWLTLVWQSMTWVMVHTPGNNTCKYASMGRQEDRNYTDPSWTVRGCRLDIKIQDKANSKQHLKKTLWIFNNIKQNFCAQSDPMSQ